MLPKSRDESIDRLRGLAIVLVILGHLLQGSTPAFDQNLVFRWIYSFHMPLFMFLSGWVWSFRPRFGPFFRSRVISLAVPFLLWGAWANRFDGTKWLQLLQYPDNGLWFFWILFLVQLLFWGALRIHRYGPWLFLLLPFAHLPWGYASVGYYGPLFALGYAARQRNLMPQFRPGSARWLLLGLHVTICVLFWHRLIPFYTLAWHAHWPHFTQTLFKYGTALLGILTAFQFRTFRIPGLAYVGQQSGNIYAIHFVLLVWFHGWPIWLGLLGCLSVTLAVNWLWERLPVFNLALPTKAAWSSSL